MRIILFLFIALPFVSSASNNDTNAISENTLLTIPSNSEKGFHNSYILFIPKGVSKNQLTYLLIEPNNTGKLSDSISVHEQAAVQMASVSSIGNNISTELKIPLLIPVFSRPASQPLMYTHALDRDVILEQTLEFERIDLQLLAMVADAKTRLKEMEILVNNKIFMNGFSASGSFTNRFLLIHPDVVAAAAMGGFNGELMLPVKKYNKTKMNYPLGINDFPKVFSEKFQKEVYCQIPQFIYMGALDENDAVQFDDAYSLNEREIINTNLGYKVQERYVRCQQIYTENKVNAQFRTYPDVGHWTTSEVNLDVILFFLNVMKSSR